MSTLKKKSKIGIIILQIFIILIVSIVSYATGALLGADEVNYNKTGNTITVEDALNELYQLANNSGGGENSGGGSSNINYGEGKTASTVEQGDTIEITFTEGNETYTEQFMVLNRGAGKIWLMPYYNLVLTTGRQATESNYSSAGTVAFSDSNYWKKYGINIDMSRANNVQSYIDAYNTKISTATGGAATAQIGRYVNGTNNAEADWNISSYSGQANSSSVKLLNPSERGSFWLGSSDPSDAARVRYVGTNGKLGCTAYYNSNGVRPVVIITYSTT